MVCVDFQIGDHMNQPYDPNRPSRRPAPQSRSTQRAEVPSARSELERERQLYSQHDPNTSLLPEREAARNQAEQGAMHNPAGQMPAGRQSNPISARNRQGAQAGQAPMGNTAGARRANQAPNPRDMRNADVQRSGQIPGPAQSGAQPSRNASAAGQRPSARANQQAAGQRPSARNSQQMPAQRPSAQARPAAQRQGAARVGTQVPQNSSQQMPAVQNIQKDASAYSRANYHRSASGNGSGMPDASAYSAARYVGNHRAQKQKANFFTRKSLIALAVVAVIAVGGVFGFTNWMNTKAVQVTLNGDQVTISGNQRSISGILDSNLVSVTAGNYIAVDGSVMRQGEGTRCTAKVNGNETDNLSTHLNGGDKIEISNGTDISEAYTDSDPQVLPHKTEIKGTGAIHLYNEDATDGEQVTRTGKESGISTQVTTKEPVDNVVQYYNIDAGNDKVIALTFDDGPWDSQTDQILDILEENGAKATFFTVGQCISGHESQVKRAASMGCEIGTHTWDHAEGSGQGVSLIKMSTQERKDEVTKGLDAIEKVTGEKASTIFRCPGGNFDSSVASDLDGIVTAEIGWNIDTTDWKKPGADVIAQRIESAKPGNVILMHDGGGDRSQTIEGLRKALPQLKAQGYSFITVQELIEKYPYKGN